jgi:hypothetical protein
VSEIYNIPATFFPSLLQPRTADFYRCCANYRGIFSCGTTAKIVPRLPLFESFRPHTIRHTHAVELLSTNDQPVVAAATYITHTHKRETNIHDHSWIRSRGCNNRAAADLRLRPRCHRNWRCYGVVRSFIQLYGIIFKYAAVFFKNAYSTLRWARNRYNSDGVTKNNGIVGHY